MGRTKGSKNKSQDTTEVDERKAALDAKQNAAAGSGATAPAPAPINTATATAGTTAAAAAPAPSWYGLPINPADVQRLVGDKLDLTNPFHPLCLKFPRLPLLELQKMAQDILLKGLAVKIKTYLRQVIDGQNRLCACLLAGVEPIFEEVTVENEGELVGMVIRLNLERRQLEKGQVAIIAAELYPRSAAANLQCSPSELAAKLMHISKRYVDGARKVLAAGMPALIEAVRKGEVKLFAAEAMAKRPRPEQEALFKNAKNDIVTAVNVVTREDFQPKKMAQAASGTTPVTVQQSVATPGITIPLTDDEYANLKQLYDQYLENKDITDANFTMVRFSRHLFLMALDQCAGTLPAKVPAA